MISIVFSFRNEEECIEPLFRSLDASLKSERETFELIFVNDDSNDQSFQAIRRESEKYPRFSVKIINMSRRFGVEECFLAGVAQAQGDAVITMYVDLQDPTELIPQMLEKWRQGAEVVHAVRHKRSGDNPVKAVLASIAYRLIARFSDVPILRDAGEFKLFSKRAAQYLVEFKESDPYLRGLAAWVGFKQDFVEYEMPPRVAGTRKVPLFGKKSWSVFVFGITSFSFLLIEWILLIGVFGTVFSVIFGIITWLQSLGSYVAFGRALTALLLFLWSTLMLALGSLGIYIARIYKDVRGRPHYIIKEVIECRQKQAALSGK